MKIFTELVQLWDSWILFPIFLYLLSTISMYVYVDMITKSYFIIKLFFIPSLIFVLKPVNNALSNILV